MAAPPPTAIVVLISGRGSNLQAIMDAVHGGTINGHIAAVISDQPGVYGLERARTAGIPTAVVARRDYSERLEFDRALLARVEFFKPGLVLLAGFMRILNEGFMERFPGRILNIHPSLLPAFPGLDTHARALRSGAGTHGASVHFVTQALDKGPLILQARVPVKPADTPESLAARVLRQEHRIYPPAVSWFCQDRLVLQDDRVLLDGYMLEQPILFHYQDQD